MPPSTHGRAAHPSHKTWYIPSTPFPTNDVTLKIEVGSGHRGTLPALGGLLARRRRYGGETLIDNKGCAGHAFAKRVTELDVAIIRRKRRTWARPPHPAPGT